MRNTRGGKVLNADFSRMNLSQMGCESERWKELAQDHVGSQDLVLVVLVVVRNALVK